ncbi:protocadherin Fat 4-like [Mercenaria mercenaria]|uniref:protocadherin Fat 4-like n=1 Tax=Mercenaria mercenaria TaxID=6596 RepID=UPI00234EE268|nr:protocadherin Fat 4-like [Mercenaria mercenaria]
MTDTSKKKGLKKGFFVKCMFCDTDNTPIIYTFVSGSGFSVSGSTLSCTITSLSASSHTVVVRAQNTGDSATTDQTLTVTVTDSSPPAPTWSTGASHLLIKGDSTACDAVTTLSATSSDCTAVTYSVQSESPSGGFSVTGSTLSCVLASITASSYTVVVRATNTGDGANSDLTLTITPAEAPVFVKPSPNAADDNHTITLLETVQADETVLTLTATDADTDDATLTFNMDASAAPTRQLFEINGRELKVKASVANDYFDAEKDGVVLQYPIILEVSDGGTSTTLSTTIDVQDVNDNSPVFSGTFTAEIKDNVAEGDTVFTITATDSDKTSTNNQVTLSMADISAFNLDGDKIKVSAGVNFDAKTQSTYTLTVTASDNAPVDPKTTDQEFTVTIKAAPEFVDPDPDSDAEFHDIYMCETIQAGDEVMTLIASDADTDTASLSFNMDASNPTTTALFEVVGDKLKVKASADTTAFDFDADNAVTEYTIILEVTDGDYTTTLTTTIRIEDDNDNAPVFSGNTTASLLESSLAGTSVLKLTATDNDKSAEYSNVTFSLSGATEFEIGGDNNDDILVAVGASFDYTTNSSYILTITASDNAPEEAQTTDQDITVSITTDPKFNKLNSAKTASVDENAPEATEIFALDVTDEDDTGTLTVSISEQPSPDMFILDGQKLKPKSGAIFDAEGDKTSYQLKFMASDGTYEVESDVLTVTVNELNDNPPVFTELDPVVDIAEKTAAGSSVYDVNATDADVGNPDNIMTFSMTETDTSHFSIDTNSGIISLKPDATLTFSSKAEYKLIVTAKDGALPTDKSASTTVTVKIYVSPEFTNPTDGDSFSIPEDSTTGSVVKALTASDEDGDSPIFTLVSQDPALPSKFKIQGSEILTTDTFDIDAAGAVTSYILEISVSDGRSYTDDETIKITIQIDDSNTKSPVFDPDGVYDKTVEETESVGTTVLSVTATDDDLTDANNKIKYSVTDTEFSIDEDTGDITVSASLSYKTKSEYNITVTATDTGTPPKSATQQVKFTLLAEPEFTNLAVAKSKAIDENLPADESVFAIAVSDLDNTWDRTVSIVSQTPREMFKMNGAILQTKTDGLDAETATAYVLKFKVTDGSFVVESANLTVNILDLNDNPPVISTVLPVSIRENMTIGSVVYDVQATDEDVTTQNSVLSYSIIAGNDDKVFSIDADNGSISLDKTLSEETYNLKVMVSDSGSTALTATTNVSIYVDANVIDECSSSPCQNGGTCSSSVNVYTCQCVPGYIGTNCETNKDECDPQPCMNNGICTDAVNFFSCNCTEGWNGTTCTDVCTSNTYGRNCKEQCNCNTSRLIPNVDNQQCDIKTGACKCNENWVGYSCEDKDECVNSSICSGSNVVCENTIGRYYCTCEQGYKNSSSNVCEIDIPSVTIPVNPGEAAVLLIVSIDRDCPDLRIPSVYENEKKKIENSIQRRLPVQKRVVVTNIECGTVTFESIIIIDKENAGQLANEISNISNSIEYDGQIVPVMELKVNDSAVNKSDTEAQKVCEAYTAIDPCAEDYECKYENGVPSCRKIGEENTGLILGLGFGVCLPLIVLAIIAAFYLYSRIKKQKIRKSSLRHKGSWNKEESPWYGRMKQNGFKIDTRHYDRNRFNENTNYKNNIYDNRHYYDLPGLGYTSI